MSFVLLDSYKLIHLGGCAVDRIFIERMVKKT